MILPGLVNAHTHLEYGSMSAMGDGLPFSALDRALIVRKSGLVRDDYLAQSHAGVHACLAGGVTTIADCSLRGHRRRGPRSPRACGRSSTSRRSAIQGDPAGLMAGPAGRVCRRTP